MVTAAEWIKVELSADDVASAGKRAQLRDDYARRRGFKPKGGGSVATNTTGCLGELAVARYEAAALDSDWTWEADVRRGYDVAGWQVRSSSRVDLGLRLNPGDVGRFILVFAHERPVMWLAGWIQAEAGWKLAVPRDHNGFIWYHVSPRHLQSLPEQNGYSRRPQLQLVDPQTPFWHEACDGFHALDEHRSCDSALGRILLERSRRVRGLLYPTTDGDRTS